MRAAAFQGGGVLGLGQVIIAEEIEARMGLPCHKIFNGIFGTSVGTIIGGALAVGKSPADIKPFFLATAPKIFKRGLWKWIHLLWRPKYGDQALEAGLKTLFGNLTLADCKVPFCATGFDWPSGRPIYFKSYEVSSESKKAIVVGYDSGIKMWQVCRSSAAAQLYFPGEHMGFGRLAIDGGNTGANAPDMLAVTQMKRFGPVSELELFSIGTGDSAWNVNPNAMWMPGALRAAANTLKLVFAAGVEAANYEAEQMLESNYHHIESVFRRDMAVDDASPEALAELIRAAQEASAINHEFFDALVVNAYPSHKIVPKKL